MQLEFHGGVGTVTGSRHLMEIDGHRVLVDAGLFQGLKELRLRNWRDPGFDPRSLRALLLTHTHIDHAGYLPRLVQQGFRAPVYCTAATRELAGLLLLDSAKIQEEDARWANKRGFSRHRPARPLYDSGDVERALALMVETPYEEWIDLGPLRARFHNAGHILGSAMVEVHAPRPGGDPAPVRLLFSGDVGRYDVPLHSDPSPPPAHDVLVIESTYGDRLHEHRPLREQILEFFEPCFARDGIVLVPAFAVGRAQQITLVLRELMDAGELRTVPIHIDSPMAVDATRIYSRHLGDASLDDWLDEDGRSRLFPRHVEFHRSREESQQLNRLSGPRVIVASSGMMTGGRILHHLVHRISDPRNLLCLVGYQAAGTRGRRLLEGARTLRVHGRDLEVRAQFQVLHGFSGHADREELLRWVRSAETGPSRVFVTHGEPPAAAALAKQLRAELGVEVEVPAAGATFRIG